MCLRNLYFSGAVVALFFCCAVRIVDAAGSILSLTDCFLLLEKIQFLNGNSSDMVKVRR